MISIALKEANRVAKTSVDRRYHTLIQQRQVIFATSHYVAAKMWHLEDEYCQISPTTAWGWT